MWFVQIWPNNRWDLIFVELEGKRNEQSLNDQLRDQYWDNPKKGKARPLDLVPWVKSESSSLLSRMEEVCKSFFHKFYVLHSGAAFDLLGYELQEERWKVERVTSGIDLELMRYRKLRDDEMITGAGKEKMEEIINRVAWKLFPLRCSVSDGLNKQ